MQIKTGCDLVFLPQFSKKISQTGVCDRIFTRDEQHDSNPAHLAGIFAAKEAVMKALGIKAGEWQNIEIVKNASGRPSVRFKSFSPKIKQVDISISHAGDYALAVVVVMLD